MKKIIIVTGVVILLAIAGRAFWAYQQKRADELSISNAHIFTTLHPSILADVEKNNSLTSQINGNLVTSASQSQDSEILDCKGDLDCFLNAMDNKCTLAKLNYTLHIDLTSFTSEPGFRATAVLFAHITKLDTPDTECVVYIQDMGAAVEYDPIRLSQLDTVGQKEYQGKINALTDWYSRTYGNYATCTGTSRGFKQVIDDIINSKMRDNHNWSCFGNDPIFPLY